MNENYELIDLGQASEVTQSTGDDGDDGGLALQPTTALAI